MFNLSMNFHRKPKSKQRETGRRLFHAKDFQSLMYPCFTICRLLGIFPYKINASTFEASKPRYILMTVMLCVYGIYASIKIFAVSSRGEIDMLELLTILWVDCNFGIGGFVMIVTLILSGPRMRLLQIISKISSRLPSESCEELSKLIHTKDIVVFVYLIGQWIIGSILYKYFFFEMYFYLVVVQMDMMYMNCVCVFKMCFKRIDDNLAHMREVMMNDDPLDPRLVYHEQRNSFLILELKAMRKEHLMINDTLQMLNIVFSLQLLTTAVMTFFNLTIGLFYYIIFTWEAKIVFSSIWEKILANMYFFLFLAYIFIKPVLIVWACETAKNQALQISTSIHDVFNSTTDKQIKDELQVFSLQIFHCENAFSAKGLTMNAKYLAAIISSIVTYILILFQFRRILFSCENNTTNNVTKAN